MIRLTEKVIDVYVVGGQSNAMGNSGGVEPSGVYRQPNPNAYMVGREDFYDVEVDSFTLMDYDANPDSFVGHLFGAEPQIALNYGINPVYFVKVTRGGSNLYDDWSSGSFLRNKMIETINYAKSHFKENNIKVRYIWYWNQWEASGGANVIDYKRDYDGLIAEILDSTGIDFSEHLIFKVNPNSSSYGATDRVTLQAQFQSIVDYKGKLIIGDDLGFHDGIHYLPDAYNEIGSRIYNSVNP
tara:strand:+ start:196 stop:918 length:723 start_codon:yes stop_codon:yes gene_type:complete